MKKVSIFIKGCLLIVFLFCVNLSASIQDMFENIESSEPNNGLVFEIAVPKQTYFFFEPVTVFGRFRNTTDNMIALVLEGNDKSGIGFKMRWNNSSLDEKMHIPSIMGSLDNNVFLIPEHGTIYFALPDKMFPVGRTKISIEYFHTQDYNQPPLEGAKIWQGKIKSNELIITSLDKESLTSQEQKQVEQEIRRHIEFFKNGDWILSSLAQSHLTRLSRYSVPILIESLNDKNAYVRAYAIQGLGRIAYKELSEEAGFERNTSSLDALLAAYDREKDPFVKRMVVNALMYFSDAPPEKFKQIIKTLNDAINQTDTDLRHAGAVVLLRVSRKDGIPVVINKMRDETYFGGEGDRKMVLGVLKEEMAKDPNWAGRIDKIERISARKPLGFVLPAAIGFVVVILAIGGILLYKKKSKLLHT